MRLQTMTKRLFFVGIILILSNGIAAKSQESGTYKETRKLLAKMDYFHGYDKTFVTLFQIGDERISDLIKALSDTDPEIRRRSQVVIRYLGNEIGMKALRGTYEKSNQFVLSGPIPIPLSDWDYKFISKFSIEKPQEPLSGLDVTYIYALVLDSSVKARTTLNALLKAKHIDDSSNGFLAREVIKYVPQTLKSSSEKTNLANLVFDSAFFINSRDREFTTAQLLALSGAKDKALVELYINRGVLSEEWWHVVINKSRGGWRFFSITQVGVS